MKTTLVSTMIAGLLLSAVSLAAPELPAREKLKPKPINKEKRVYIVQLADDPIASYNGSIPGLAPTSKKPTQTLRPPQSPGTGEPTQEDRQQYAQYLKSRRNQVLSSVPRARTVYEYKEAFNGFAALMSRGEAETLRARKDVRGVWEDELLKLHTDSTPAFLGLSSFPGPWILGATGESVVIGVIDSGIHPEHPSVADVKTPAYGAYGPNKRFRKPPASFTGEGCEFGNLEANPEDAPFDCNRKLVKAQYFAESFLSISELADYEYLSARDSGGHGTHTATTAGGNYGVESDIAGTVSGMAPRAHIAVYKACWDATDPDFNGCYSSDTMAAIDQAVADGVDVINYSIGGSSTAFNSPADLAFLSAADAGVFVATSAGNSGPDSQTIGTPSGVPWVTSVAAAEDNQNFGTGLQVSTPAEIATTYEGLEGDGPVTLADSGSLSTSLVPAQPLEACSELANAEELEGQIALVIRGECGFSDKYNYAAAAGARAIVVYNDGTGSDRIDPIVMSAPDTTIPGIMIGHADGALIAGSADTQATLSPEIAVSRQDRITGFSSRGPNGGAGDLIKPDLAAPGVGIIAGVPPLVGNGSLFAPMSGTSMASPHVAGIMALLKQAHPEWSPAMAKSALMTTARTNLRKSFGPLAADPFDMGSGAVDPIAAFNPGLVYDLGLGDYLAFLCGAEDQPEVVQPETCNLLQSLGYSLDSSDLNLPSVGIAELLGGQTVSRRVTNAAPHTSWYWAQVDAPEGVDVQVSPRFLSLDKGESADITLTFSVTDSATMNEWAFGSLTWHSLAGFYEVRSPIAVKPVPFAAPQTASGSGTDSALSFDVEFGYSGDYQLEINGLAEAAAFPGAVADGGDDLIFFEVPEGTNFMRVALFDEDVGAGNGSDDLDLQVFGPESAGFPLVGASGSPTSAESVDLGNPQAGTYAVFVIDYASAEGPTPYTLFNFNLTGDNGNTQFNAPASVQPGDKAAVSVEWMGLSPGTRALGIIRHSDGSEVLAETEVMVRAD